MAGKFDRDEVAELLVDCHRHCCICHRFCGVKMETDHIEQGGGDDIKNAIPVCLECHAEIHCYNVKHPRGRKFTAEELRQHKNQWLSICKDKPEIFVEAFHTSGVGPLNSLIDELEYNLKACICLGSLLHAQQFKEAIRKGAISFLEPDLKNIIYAAYTEISHLNQLHDSFTHDDFNKGRGVNMKRQQIEKAKPITKEAIEKALEELLKFLQIDTDK
jgi:hypothetical protein